MAEFFSISLILNSAGLKEINQCWHMFLNTISARFNKHNCALSCDMFHHNLELRKFLSEWGKHSVNKDLLSVENVNLLICYFPMNLTFVNMVGGVSVIENLSVEYICFTQDGLFGTNHTPHNQMKKNYSGNGKHDYPCKGESIRNN